MEIPAFLWGINTLAALAAQVAPLIIKNAMPWKKEPKVDKAQEPLYNIKEIRDSEINEAFWSKRRHRVKTTAVIMAGGRGERFWPKSRSSLPKQFLSLTDDGKTMIQLTAERLLPLVSYQDMFIVANKSYMALVHEQLPQVPQQNILAEPKSCNTAPAIGLAATVIQKRYSDAVMLILPSDHLIMFNDLYMDTMAQAVEVAGQDHNLVTIGITPTYPETGYGYINFARDQDIGGHRGVYKVRRFVEKPTLDIAKEYVKSGQYLWNSGMFAWKASTILKQYEALIPETFNGLQKIGQAIGSAEYEQTLLECFEEFACESIDCAIMEKSDYIYTIPGGFGWDDVGSWLSMERINRSDENGNTIQGDVLSVDTKNTVILGDSKLIAAVGVDNLVIVDTPDALLVCAKGQTQDVKKVIETLKICNRYELL